jgi:hypothetical protein
MFIVPNGVPEVVNSGEKQMQESSQTASFKFSWTGTSHRGVGLCCVLLEADMHALALVLVSTMAAIETQSAKCYYSLELAGLSSPYFLGIGYCIS